MEYRTLGKTGIKTSILGFGCMRLPTLDPRTEAINHEVAIKIIRKGIDGGINYIDTAEAYHVGESEVVLGKALKDGYREKIILASKSPVWRDDYTKPKDFEKFLEIQLKRLELDSIDIYLLHGLNKKLWDEKVLPMKLIERAKRAQREGKYRFLGFSFHDKPEVCKEIIDTGAFQVMLVQYNILDTTLKEMIDYATRKGLGVAIMGPIGGGRLAGEVIEELRYLLTPGRSKFTDLALRFVWSNPNVSVALSGMGSEAMVDDNLSLANSKNIKLATKELEKTKILAQTFKSLTDNICTSCGYCMKCPNDVNIPSIFKYLISHQVYGQKLWAKVCYQNIGNVKEFWAPGKNASACTECGECETKCPQKIPIIDQLKKAHEVLSK